MDKQQLKQTIDDNITTNGQNEITGAKLNDVLNEMVDSLGVVNQISVGTTTTGAAGTNASVTNSGTATNPVFDFTIPRGANGHDGADAVSHFKGWYDAVITGEAGSKVITSETQNLPANPIVGNYAYVKTLSISGTAPSQTETPIVKIYSCATAGTWTDTGMEADTSNVQTFASGEEVNETPIDDTHLVNPLDNSLAVATDVNEQLIITETSTITGTSGKLNTSGIRSSNNSYYTSDFIKVSEGDVIIYKATANSTTGAVCGYSGNTENTFTSLLLKGQTSGGNPVTFDSEINIPSGIAYIRVSYAGYPYSNNISLLHYRFLKDRVAALEEKQVEIENVIEEIPDFSSSYEVQFDVDNVRLLKSNGAEDTNSTYCATGYIPIKEGRKAIYTGAGNASLVVNLAGYSDNQGNGYVSLLANDSYNNREVAIPSGVNYVRACAKKDSPYSLTITETVFDAYDKKFAETIDKFNGKVIAVIGDSISTGSGLNPFWIVRSSDVGNQIESWVTYYDVFTANGSATNKSIGGTLLTSSMIGTKQTFTPILEDVGKAIGSPVTYYGDSNGWAYQLCKKIGATLINASWSGSSMNSGQVTTVNGVNQDSCSYGWHDCTIGRCSKRDGEGNVINPDVIIIYKGTNDFSHSPYAYLDGYDINNGYPETDVYDVDKYGFERAYYLTIAKLRDAYPNAYIFCSTLNVFKRGLRDRFPVRSSATGRNYSLPDMNDVIRKIADKMGCGIINFDKSGITFENCYPTYINDSADMPTHPNSTGQMVLANRAFVDLNYYIQTT